MMLRQAFDRLLGLCLHQSVEGPEVVMSVSIVRRGGGSHGDNS